MDNVWRRLLKRFHPEGIIWPASVFYRALSNTQIFARHYELVADDVASYGPADGILDIGTGPGQLLLALRNTLPEAKLVGVDISPSMVSLAERTIRSAAQDPGMDVQVADAANLPFADETFERVISTGSLHHWKDAKQALAEAHRVLTTGGYALMYDLVSDMPKAISKDVRAQFGGFRLALLWLHSFEEPFLNVEEMVALGKETGFMVEGTKFTGALCCLVLRKVA